jgi:muramoyltetrapeptide carboxypeptidase
MTALAPLAPGARVALVATSGRPLAPLVERSVALLRDLGLEPVVYPSVTAPHPRADYLAGSDAGRAADLKAAWCDPAIDAVFCLRGGYGAVRVLDLLDAGLLAAARPKPLFGSSDVTAVHEYWLERLGAPTWFSPMLATPSLLDDPVALEGLRRAIFEPTAGREFTSAAAETITPGSATGVLMGGTLSLLAMTIGARGRPAASNAGRIALLEDVTEEPYRLDGLFTALLRSGWFDGVVGIALGSWEKCGEPGEVRALAEELLTPLGVPLVWELGFGHGAAAHSIPLGVSATLVADDRPRLVLAE